ncbi:AAA family ATPase [Flavobacterium covae]
MKINTLELTNVRGFTYAKLDFQPGFNLIVGINGVGKTTALESLRIVLSHILSEIKAPLISKESFKKSDININTDQLQVNTNFSIDGSSYDFIYSKSRQGVVFKDVESNTSQNKNIRRDIEAQNSVLAQKSVDLEKLRQVLSVKEAIEALISEGILKQIEQNDKKKLIDILNNFDSEIGTDNDYLNFLKSLSNKDLENSINILGANKDINENIQQLQAEINKLSETISKSNLIPSREEGIQQEDSTNFKSNIERTKNNNLLGIYFSTRRSLIVNQTAKVVKSKFSYAAAYVDTLSDTRSFNIKMFADWYKTRKELAKENPTDTKYNKVIQLIQEAIYTFLPEFSELDLDLDDITKELTFCIKKGEKKLNFTQLSDGERGILALVFDIARRLIIANDYAENPLHGEAVILIDELDLHLHPKWQRTIVKDLERTFPNCQFIATTHSPQIISSVLPENIQIIKDFQIDQAVKSYGLDINYILKHIMEDDDRLDESKKAIEAVQSLIDEIEFDKARALIEEYKKNNLDLSEWIMFEARMSHLEMFEDEEDN